MWDYAGVNTLRPGRLPVLRGRQLVGIVSRANLLHALASLAPTVPATAATDETIRKLLLTELEHQKWAPVGFLNVVVQNGVVELWGTITDDRERQALIVAAQNIPGVKDVRDHLVWVEPTSGVVIGAGGEVLARHDFPIALCGHGSLPPDAGSRGCADVAQRTARLDLRSRELQHLPRHRQSERKPSQDRTAFSRATSAISGRKPAGGTGRRHSHRPREYA